MRSDKVNRHIGLVHGDKANKKQQKEAMKARSDKWIICERCKASMLKKNSARHLRACDGEAEYVVSETWQRNKAKRGRKPRARLVN